MRKLTLADATFLYNETPRTPMHIASVQRLQLPAGMDGVAFTRALRAQVQGRLHRVPYLTQQLVETPWQLDHPSFATVREVHLGRHIHRVDADAPGDERAFESTVARLHAKPLDRSRPLWEMVVIDKLVDRRVAVYSRVHHSCIDGIAGQAATRNLYDADPAGDPVPAPGVIAPEPADHPAVAVIRAFENFRHAESGLLHALPGMVTAWDKVQRRLRGESADWNGGQGPAPMTPFNRAVGQARTWACAAMPLADLKRVGRNAGATLNDVILAICGGGLRRWLQRDNALPAQSLLAGCPVSLRTPGDTTANNQVSMMRVALGSHLDNPLVRLLYVKEASRHARHLTVDALGLMPPSVALPALPAAMRLAAMTGDWLATANQPLPMPVNVVISNVPGPVEPLYIAGARIESHYPVSIPAHGLAVNITVQSHAGQMFLGITACARALPDAQGLRDDLMGAFTDLRNQVLPLAATVRQLPAVPVAAVATSTPVTENPRHAA